MAEQHRIKKTMDMDLHRWDSTAEIRTELRTDLELPAGCVPRPTPGQRSAPARGSPRATCGEVPPDDGELSPMAHGAGCSRELERIVGLRGCAVEPAAVQQACAHGDGSQSTGL